MPWSSSDADKHIKGLSTHQKTIWASVANSALEECTKEGKDNCDASAIRQANAAAKSAKKAEAYVESSLLIGEIGKKISAANSKQIKAAIQAMKSALEVIAPLIADDADEEVVESNPLVETEHALIENLRKWELVNLNEAAKILAQSDSYDNKRNLVSHALRKRALSDALKDKISSNTNIGYSDYYGSYDHMPYISDLYDGSVVYTLGGSYYQCDYSISGNDVTLGDPTEVQISYVPKSKSSESSSSTIQIELKGELIQLTEKAVKEDGSARVKLISPGWGSSGYYSKEMLKRDGPKVFPKGTHMYMNHPTEEEDRVRPERDLRDLAGVIASEVKWEDASNNNTGEGLYADVKVLPTYRSFIDEAAPFIGVSIRAAGTAVEGEADNRHGLLVDSLKEGYSVDYVTMAGRGGEVLSLYESARNKIVAVKIDEVTKDTLVQTTELEEVYNVDITKEELDQLRESANKANTLETKLTETATALEASNRTVARMQEAMLLSEARNIVTDTLATIQMPDVVRARLAVECAKNPPVKEDRTLDTTKLVESVKETAANEMKYLESVTGSVTNGRVIGMTAPVSTELKAEEVDNELTEAWKGYGLNDDESKIASIGRFN